MKMDWKNPDYSAIFRLRMENLRKLEERPELIPELKEFYKLNPDQFIDDWGVTYDPRNPERGLPALIPFILFPKQREWIRWVVDHWKNQQPGLCEKSRDMGVTWLAVGTACTLCIFYDGLTIGFGSRKSEYVDKIGMMKPILPKARMFMEHIPEIFRAGFVPWRDAPYMKVGFPDSGSIITGEGGDDIGRGDRASIYFVDEAAHLERPELIEASLSQTTNCRIDMSSVRGMNNVFAQKRWAPRKNDDNFVFIFDWRDDPRKDDAWYAKQEEQLDPVVVAQEIDRDYSASVKGIVIPGIWVRAAIDAKKKLGIAPSGSKGLAFDVADEGADKDAFCRTHGTEVIETDEWSGKGSDIFESVEYIFDVCDEHGYDEFRYDSDGLGAGVRGDSRVLNERRKANNAKPIRAVGYRGSAEVYDPDGIVEGTIGSEGDEGRTNKDYFHNRKSQAWWALRKRFQKTYRWVTSLQKYQADPIKNPVVLSCPPDDIISLSSENPKLQKLVAELSQATYRQSEVGKLLIEKKGKGMPSPNMADSVVIRYAPMEAAPVEITGDMLAQIARAGVSRRGRG
jgi:phage terminase large subunit